MKTIREWLSELPEEIAKEAIEETIRLSDEIHLSVKDYSLKEALLGMFCWDKSKKGNDYWLEIVEKYAK